MALNDILTSMDGARDALVTAINAKGGSLADNATLYQCANAVGSLSGGTSAEYYKCASVDTGGVITDGKTIVVVDTVWDIWSGTYTLVDESATGDARVWKDAATGFVLKKYDFDGLRWGFWQSDTINYAGYLQDGVHENPWDATLYVNDEAGEDGDFTLTPSTTTVLGNTWSGYKAVFDSTAGTWSFESGVTAGLTYTSVTPIVGGIYSADALVIVSLLYTGTPTLTSPTGMTSESSDEWEISASSFYSTNSAPWKAFDGVTGSSSGWTGASNSSWWLQWQNKTKPVLVQKLRFQGTASGDIAQQAITSFILQGSDDGSTWTDLYTASGLTWTTGYEWKEFTFSNSKSYYYHRLANITVAANYPTIVELETYDM